MKKSEYILCMMFERSKNEFVKIMIKIKRKEIYFGVYIDRCKKNNRKKRYTERNKRK